MTQAALFGVLIDLISLTAVTYTGCQLERSFWPQSLTLTAVLTINLISLPAVADTRRHCKRAAADNRPQFYTI